MQRWPVVTLDSIGEVTLTMVIVLHVEGERAADAAIGADGVGLGLLGFLPGAGGAHVVLGLEHQAPVGHTPMQLPQ